MGIKPQLQSFILELAPTGLVPIRDQAPLVPYQTDEILAQVAECLQLGLTLVHLHVRDKADRPSLDPEFYGNLITELRRLDPELVVCISLSGRGGSDLSARLAPLDLDGDAKPDLASLTPSSLNFTREASINDPATVIALAQGMVERGIVPELELFDLGMANEARYLVERGYLPTPLYANLMLGNRSGIQPDPLSFGTLLANLPPTTIWSAAGLGRAQISATALGLACGGGVRTGLEDNLYFDHARQEPACNLALVQRVHELAALHERPLCRSAELRAQLGLAPGHGSYGRA